MIFVACWFMTVFHIIFSTISTNPKTDPLITKNSDGNFSNVNKSQVYLANANYFRAKANYPHGNSSKTEHIVNIHDASHSRSVQYYCPDISCNWSYKHALVNKLFVRHTNITIIMSMEGPANYNELRTSRKLFDAYAVPSMNADIPLVWLNNLTDLYKKQVNLHDVKNEASFIARNCNSKNKREQLVKDIQSVFPVASLSSCLNNRHRINFKGDWANSKIKEMQKYAFHLAFENQNEDHMTEKLWYALQAGTVPIYFGSKDAEKYAPRHSFISAHNFKNGVELGQYMKRVVNNVTLYNSFHTWRSSHPPSHLIKMYDPFKESIQCRICRWVANKTTKASL